MPAVWYRASEQCPSGPDFLLKLTGGAAAARLAQAGDHIDFLVTLVATGAETVGRLERQTRGGTVAIRELRDASCERVAEGLALSLGLALEPGHGAPALDAVLEPPPTAESATPPPRPNAEAPNPTTLSEVTPPQETAHARAPSSATPRPAMNTPSVEASHLGPTARAQWSLGAEAGPLFGLAPSPMVRASLFANVDPVWPALDSRLSLRLGLVGASVSADTPIGPVRHWLLAARAEACPWRWGPGRLSLRPCLDLEIGAAGAAGQGSNAFGDALWWLAPGAGLRGSVALPARIALEVGANVQMPLQRSEVFVGTRSLYRAEIALFRGTLGISVGLP